MRMAAEKAADKADLIDKQYSEGQTEHAGD